MGNLNFDWMLGFGMKSLEGGIMAAGLYHILGASVICRTSLPSPMLQYTKWIKRILGGPRLSLACLTRIQSDLLKLLHLSLGKPHRVSETKPDR